MKSRATPVSNIEGAAPEPGEARAKPSASHAWEFHVVHTARRTYRLNGSVKISDCGLDAFGQPGCGKLFKPHHLEEGEVVTRFP